MDSAKITLVRQLKSEVEAVINKRQEQIKLLTNWGRYSLGRFLKKIKKKYDKIEGHDEEKKQLVEIDNLLLECKDVLSQHLEKLNEMVDILNVFLDSSKKDPGSLGNESLEPVIGAYEKHFKEEFIEGIDKRVDAFIHTLGEFLKVDVDIKERELKQEANNKKNDDDRWPFNKFTRPPYNDPRVQAKTESAKLSNEDEVVSGSHHSNSNISNEDEVDVSYNSNLSSSKSEFFSTTDDVIDEDYKEVQEEGDIIQQTEKSCLAWDKLYADTISKLENEDRTKMYYVPSRYKEGIQKDLESLNEEFINTSNSIEKIRQLITNSKISLYKQTSFARSFLHDHIKSEEEKSKWEKRIKTLIDYQNLRLESRKAEMKTLDDINFVLEKYNEGFEKVKTNLKDSKYELESFIFEINELHRLIKKHLPNLIKDLKEKQELYKHIQNRIKNFVVAFKKRLKK